MQLWHVLVRVLRLCRMGAETMETWEIISLLVRPQLCSSSGKKNPAVSGKAVLAGEDKRPRGAESMSSGEKNRRGTQSCNSAGALRQLTEDWPALTQRKRYDLNHEDGTCTGGDHWKVCNSRSNLRWEGEELAASVSASDVRSDAWSSPSENEHQGLQPTRQKQDIGINAECRHKPCRKEKCDLCFTGEMNGLMFYQFI